MAVSVNIPRIGSAVADVTIIKWCVKEGDKVEKSQVIAIVETEKVSSNVESPDSGFIHIVVAEEGSTLPVGTMIAQLAATTEELASLQEGNIHAIPAPAPSTPSPTAGAEERIKITPVARKVAEENFIDISTLTGTGPGGRIAREDVEKVIATKETISNRKVKSTIPIKSMRKAIAEHTLKSLSTAAQLTRMGEMDMTEIVKLYKALVEQEAVLGTRISYTDILVLILAKALKQHPNINSSLIDNEIKVWEDINIGVAVALDEGLIVPVIKNADKKSLVEISKTVKGLVEKAHSGKLSNNEISGGTFTLSNVGSLRGGYSFETPIINQPESAIILTGAIIDRVVARDGAIVIRPIMTYSFTYDHRLIDGAATAQFMADVIKIVEDPGLLLV